MLLWVVYVRWPLTLEELQAALAMKIGCKIMSDTEQHLIGDDLQSSGRDCENPRQLDSFDTSVCDRVSSKLGGALVCSGKTPDTHMGKFSLTYLTLAENTQGLVAEGRFSQTY